MQQVIASCYVLVHLNSHVLKLTCCLVLAVTKRFVYYCTAPTAPWADIALTHIQDLVWTLPLLSWCLSANKCLAVSSHAHAVQAIVHIQGGASDCRSKG